MHMVPGACLLGLDDLLTRKKNTRSCGTKTIYYNDLLLHLLSAGAHCVHYQRRVKSTRAIPVIMGGVVDRPMVIYQGHVGSYLTEVYRSRNINHAGQVIKL